MDQSFDRRQFLTMSGWLFFALHGETLAKAAAAVNGVPGSHEFSDPQVRIPLIKELRLKTHRLAEQKAFYRDTLGLEVAAQTAKSVTLRAGSTLLRFEQVEDASEPWYHFAFNIPQNMILPARKWQLERTKLLPIPERLRDLKYPDDVVDYSHWNAHSIFFYDPAGNVVEYIARHDLHNDASGGFSAKSILYASEIGFIVDDVTSTASDVERLSGRQQYRGGDENFMAVGDEYGLLLVMKRGRILNFQPKSQEKAAKVYVTEALIEGASAKQYGFKRYPYSLLVRPST